MKTDRDVEKMVARMGLKHGSRPQVVQYGKGMLEGMRLAYRAVAQKMLLEGYDTAAVRKLLENLVAREELDALLEEAAR